MKQAPFVKDKKCLNSSTLFKKTGWKFDCTLSAGVMISGLWGHWGENYSAEACSHCVKVVLLLKRELNSLPECLQVCIQWWWSGWPPLQATVWVIPDFWIFLWGEKFWRTVFCVAETETKLSLFTVTPSCQCGGPYAQPFPDNRIVNGFEVPPHSIPFEVLTISGNICKTTFI